MAGDEREHGPHPLAAGHDEVAGDVVGEPVRLGDRLEQAALDLAEAGPHGLVERGVGQPEVERGSDR